MSCCTDQAPLRMTMIEEAKSDNQLIPVVKLKCQKNCDRCKEKQGNKSSDKKKQILLAALLLFVMNAWAQDSATTKTFWDDPFNNPMTPIYVVTTFVFITIVLVLVVALYLLKILNIFIRQTEKEKALASGIKYVPQPSWLQRSWDKLNAAVPVAQEQDIDMGHNFDGIRELDNHLPPWWKWLFYATIVWSVIYIGVYHLFNTLPLSIGEYQNELVAAEESARIYKASQPAEAIDENTLTFTNDAAIIAKGKSVFLGSCVPCHRNDGGGNTIGPNLTDAYWLHGGAMKNIFTTIKTGVVEKGMPAWGKAMSPQDVRNVAFYIMSLQGTNPPNAKAPQGELFKSDTTSVKRDSLIVKLSPTTIN